MADDDALEDDPETGADDHPCPRRICKRSSSATACWPSSFSRLHQFRCVLRHLCGVGLRRRRGARAALLRLLGGGLRGHDFYWRSPPHKAFWCRSSSRSRPTSSCTFRASENGEGGATTRIARPARRRRRMDATAAALQRSSGRASSRRRKLERRRRRRRSRTQINAASASLCVNGVAADFTYVAAGCISISTAAGGLDQTKRKAVRRHAYNDQRLPADLTRLASGPVIYEPRRAWPKPFSDLVLVLV